jgi:hypothetical protein
MVFLVSRRKGRAIPHIERQSRGLTLAAFHSYCVWVLTSMRNPEG